jgi:ATP phosphoribosyltransferase
MEKTFDWFADRGIDMRRSGSDREYAAQVDGADVDLVLLSAGEIPRELQAGRIHLGVTGSDLVRERIPAWQDVVRELQPMGFGFADLIIAVPAFWVDVNSLDDLDAAAADFRRRHGHRLRIATKYHRLVREFLRDAGVADYQLVDSQGATEGTVKNLTAEAIADITSTGETLRANHLTILPGGLIHRSQAVLFKSRTADWSNGNKEILEDLVDRLYG